VPEPAAPHASPTAEPDDPARWLGTTPLLDLQDPRLRLRVRSLTQLCKSTRDKALSLYGFVKRIPFSKPVKLRLNSAREVLDLGRGDAVDKVVLLIALLRIARIPARIRYVELRGDILRGLTTNVASAARPVAEAWLHGRWVRNDTYIFDAGYMAAARQRLKDQDWQWGYGIGRDGHAIWNGVDDAFVGGRPTESDPMVLADLGVFNDPFEFVTSDVYRKHHARLARALQWNLLAPMIERSIRELREETAGGVPAPQRKTS